MLSRIRRWTLAAGALTSATLLPPAITPAYAQGWGNGQSCWNLQGRDRARCERDRDRWNGGGRDRDRDRDRAARKDAKTDGIVAGVIGTALIGGIIAAAASSDKKKRRTDDRRDYCEQRYGSYDDRTDSYRAADGRWYPCT